MSNPKITFGMIVLNGEPFVLYNLRALYPFAHQIIVVEGACRVVKSLALPDGHSSDGTLETIRKFKVEEDYENKVTVVSAFDEGYDDGFWPEKDEMSKAYAKRATGNYLWQVDIDEFYLPQDMRYIIDLLNQEPEIRGATFRTLTFWGGLNYLVSSFRLQNDAFNFRRLFAWGEGFSYKTHRPPTVIDKKGEDVMNFKVITGRELAKKGIFLYHYSLLFPKQVKDKSSYYSRKGWSLGFLKYAETWYKESYLKIKYPFRIHRDYPFLSWIKPYKGEHPPQVLAMADAVKSGRYGNISFRETEDIEHLLADPTYKTKRAILEFFVPCVNLAYFLHSSGFRLFSETTFWVWLRNQKSRIIRRLRNQDNKFRTYH